ncbi:MULTISPECIES: hypothetical protein [Methylorubrum]|uniref:hypothetical protein n=1 Tax=Methylorubrum TaxID=2282523 RepID=UPI00209FF0E1|nr:MULTISPECIES: hypothetical protein [Methylorubrum]MCP1548420.1 hypothetical protein [Methylorubrum zatmanii]MCP1554965.1 hypothetical protein [Methylorubrum extorquens]MCP1578723.1 hypothetical protein [Methylorubrum extorquens]
MRRSRRRSGSSPVSARPFMETPKGKLAQYRRRKNKRLRIWIDDIEPQSKKMSAKDKDAFQETLAQKMSELKRSSFRGSIALRVDLATTSKTAPHVHTIAKNLLDLFGMVEARVGIRQKSLLYKDDSQIHALEVLCRHGEDYPSISVEARPLRSMLDDVELGLEAMMALYYDNPQDEYEKEIREEAIRDLKRMKDNEAAQRSRMGDLLYEAMLKLTRSGAQDVFLRKSILDIEMLAYLYRCPRGPFQPIEPEAWVQLMRKSSFRIDVGELPTARGNSNDFRHRIDSAIACFKARWDWLLKPLVVPVGLQLIVRPDFNTPSGVLHDLDNIVRDYLLPRFTPEFGTVSDRHWTIDFEELERTSPELASRWREWRTPPKGTRDGVIGYNAWRLPAVEGAPGFVNAALVVDPDLDAGIFRRLDNIIDRWEKEIVSTG